VGLKQSVQEVDGSPVGAARLHDELRTVVGLVCDAIRPRSIRLFVAHARDSTGGEAGEGMADRFWHTRWRGRIGTPENDFPEHIGPAYAAIHRGLVTRKLRGRDSGQRMNL